MEAAVTKRDQQLADYMHEKNEPCPVCMGNIRNGACVADVVWGHLAAEHGRPMNSTTPLSEIAEDSLSRLALMHEIEDIIGRQLPGDDVLKYQTVGDVMDAVRKIA